jgi:coronin-7
VLPIDAAGRQDRKAIPKINAHNDMVTDFAFSPFDDGLLATGSQDQTVKLWKIPKEGLKGDLTKPEMVLPEQPRRVETVTFHPTADCILATSSGQGVSVWDMVEGRSVYEWDGHEDQVQAVDWQRQGRLLATHAKDKMVRVFDPRTGGEPSQETKSHDGMKDSKVVWIGEHRILTSGFGQDRSRQLAIRDIRNIATPEHVLSLDVSSGILVPLYDPDTNMVFLSGKGDRYIQFVEVTDHDPFFVPGLRYTGEQIKGGCLVPKRAMDVMKGEVNRVLQLADSSIIPITWQVPRKTYRDFHADIFPDTVGPVPAMGPADWIKGANAEPAKITLDPAKREENSTHFQPGLNERKYAAVAAGEGQSTAALQQKTEKRSSAPTVEVTKAEEAESSILRPEIRERRTAEDGSFLMQQVRPKSPMPKRASKFGRATKFKHLKGTPLHKSQHFENLKNLSKSVAAECDIIHANTRRVAVPLSGPGGKIGVFETQNAGRIPDGVIPCLINSSTVMDFAWDPFNEAKLVCVTEEGTINIWNIPEEGLKEQVNEPDQKIVAHVDRVSIIKFNPIAEGIVATASYDCSIKIWNLSNVAEEQITLSGHSDQIYSFDWSQCGRFIASSCKDGKVRIYNPRNSSEPIVEGGTIVPKKGSRIVWTLDGEFLVVTGFSKQSERTVTVYRTKDLKSMSSETLNVSPAVLVPFYDEDSSTLFLNGKGENSLFAYEVALDPPHLFALSPFKSTASSQGFGFLRNKSALNVREIEFARAYRLTNNTIEPVSFTVPRVKSTYFQDDLFPPTRVLWEPTISAEKWLKGENGEQAWMSLKPADMRSLSGEAQTVTPAKRVSSNGSTSATGEDKSAKDKAKGLTDAVSGILSTSNDLEQDRMEGVDSKEWD